MRKPRDKATQIGLSLGSLVEGVPLYRRNNQVHPFQKVSRHNERMAAVDLQQDIKTGLKMSAVRSPEVAVLNRHLTKRVSNSLIMLQM